MTYISSFYQGLFRKYNFVVSQLKHLTPNTTSLEISKMWSTFFPRQNCRGYLEICPDSSFLKINKTDKILISSGLKF